MRVTPIPQAGSVTSNVQQGPSIHNIRMTTNATPEFIPPVQNGQPLQTDNNETQATVAATQKLDPQLARIAKQRRALQLKEQEILNREKALQSATPNNPGIAIERLKSDPIGTLRENGITYDDLTQAILKSQENQEVYALREKVSALEKGIDEKFQAQNAQSEKQVLAEMRREAIQLAKASDDFELVREMRSIPDVMRLIEQTYRKTGEVLEVRQAMKLVESELLKDAQRIAKAKKLQSEFVNPHLQQTQAQQRYTGMRTLTNKQNATPQMSPKARALAAFWGNKQMR